MEREQAYGIAKKNNIDNTIAAIEQACYQGKDYVNCYIPFLDNVKELMRMGYSCIQINECGLHEISWGDFDYGNA